MIANCTYIKTRSELDQCLSDLRSNDVLGLDLEFDKNRYAFGFNLSMIQINNGNNIYLIDALTIDDLTPVFDIFSDASVKKIVFAFGEDIRLLHSIGCFPKNICDLSIAANLLNYPPCSLSALTQSVLEIEEKESSQKSNWLKRPLTDAQLSYAAEDVRYLQELSDELEKDIATRNITQWFKEENNKYDLVDYSGIQNFSPIKTKEKKDLTEYQLHILEQLVELRESIAEQQNKPGYHIVSKDVLMGLTKGTLLLSDMFKLKGISKYFKNAQSKSEIHEILTDSANKSKKLELSLTAPAIRKLDREEYQQMQLRKKRSDKIITTLLQPIKDEVKTSYGENTASFIFSNKIMNDISREGLSEQPPYKQKLIWDLSNQLGLDLGLLS